MTDTERSTQQLRFIHSVMKDIRMIRNFIRMAFILLLLILFVIVIIITEPSYYTVFLFIAFWIIGFTIILMTAFSKRFEKFYTLVDQKLHPGKKIQTETNANSADIFSIVILSDMMCDAGTAGDSGDSGDCDGGDGGDGDGGDCGDGGDGGDGGGGDGGGGD